MPGWYRWLAERAARFRRVPVHRRLYLLQIMIYLLAARLALRVIPFRWLTWFFERPARRPEDAFAERAWLGASAQIPYTVCKDEIVGVERERLRKVVRWLANEATWFLPGKTVCLPRAIVAQAFLRRLGLGTTLYYGAATLPERGLTAHAWLQDGSEVVIGNTGGQDYHVLAHYPGSQSVMCGT